MKAILALAVMAAALLTGCAVATPHAAPTAPIAPAIHTSHTSSAAALATCKPHGHRRCRSSSPSPAGATTRSSPSPTDKSSPTLTTSPGPGPTATSPPPSPRSTGPVCVTSKAMGQCGPYAYPANTASSGYNTYVGQDVWHPIPGWSQTLHATDPGNWHVTANMPAGNTAVVSYPSNGQGSSGNGTAPRISSYSSLTSTFAEDMHSGSGTDAEAAYDIWTVAGDEIMIQHDFSALRPRCSAAAGDPVLATVGFAEPGTGTIQDWKFCEYGSERIWQFAGNEQSGSVDIRAMLTWVMNKGYLPKNSELGLVGYGFEICSTGGHP